MPIPPPLISTINHFRPPIAQEGLPHNLIAHLRTLGAEALSSTHIFTRAALIQDGKLSSNLPLENFSGLSQIYTLNINNLTLTELQKLPTQVIQGLCLDFILAEVIARQAPSTEAEMQDLIRQLIATPEVRAFLQLNTSEGLANLYALLFETTGTGLTIEFGLATRVLILPQGHRSEDGVASLPLLDLSSRDNRGLARNWATTIQAFRINQNQPLAESNTEDTIDSSSASGRVNTRSGDSQQPAVPAGIRPPAENTSVAIRRSENDSDATNTRRRRTPQNRPEISLYGVDGEPAYVNNRSQLYGEYKRLARFFEGAINDAVVGTPQAAAINELLEDFYRTGVIGTDSLGQLQQLLAEARAHCRAHSQAHSRGQSAEGDSASSAKAEVLDSAHQWVSRALNYLLYPSSIELGFEPPILPDAISLMRFLDIGISDPNWNFRVLVWGNDQDHRTLLLTNSDYRARLSRAVEEAESILESAETTRDQRVFIRGIIQNLRAAKRYLRRLDKGNEGNPGSVRTINFLALKEQLDYVQANIPAPESSSIKSSIGEARELLTQAVRWEEDFPDRFESRLRLQSDLLFEQNLDPSSPLLLIITDLKAALFQEGESMSLDTLDHFVDRVEQLNSTGLEEQLRLSFLPEIKAVREHYAGRLATQTVAEFMVHAAMGNAQLLIDSSFADPYIPFKDLFSNKEDHHWSVAAGAMVYTTYLFKTWQEIRDGLNPEQLGVESWQEVTPQVIYAYAMQGIESDLWNGPFREREWRSYFNDFRREMGAERSSLGELQPLSYFDPQKGERVELDDHEVKFIFNRGVGKDQTFAAMVGGEGGDSIWTQFTPGEVLKDGVLVVGNACHQAAATDYSISREELFVLETALNASKVNTAYHLMFGTRNSRPNATAAGQVLPLVSGATGLRQDVEITDRDLSGPFQTENGQTRYKVSLQIMPGIESYSTFVLQTPGEMVNDMIYRLRPDQPAGERLGEFYFPNRTEAPPFATEQPEALNAQEMGAAMASWAPQGIPLVQKVEEERRARHELRSQQATKYEFLTYIPSLLFMGGQASWFMGARGAGTFGTAVFRIGVEALVMTGLQALVRGELPTLKAYGKNAGAFALLHIVTRGLIRCFPSAAAAPNMPPALLGAGQMGAVAGAASLVLTLYGEGLASLDPEARSQIGNFDEFLEVWGQAFLDYLILGFLGAGFAYNNPWWAPETAKHLLVRDAHKELGNYLELISEYSLDAASGFRQRSPAEWGDLLTRHHQQLSSHMNAVDSWIPIPAKRAFRFDGPMTPAELGSAIKGMCDALNIPYADTPFVRLLILRYLQNSSAENVYYGRPETINQFLTMKAETPVGATDPSTLLTVIPDQRTPNQSRLPNNSLPALPLPQETTLEPESTSSTIPPLIAPDEATSPEEIPQWRPPSSQRRLPPGSLPPLLAQEASPSSATPLPPSILKAPVAAQQALVRAYELNLPVLFVEVDEETNAVTLYLDYENLYVAKSAVRVEGNKDIARNKFPIVWRDGQALVKIDAQQSEFQNGAGPLDVFSYQEPQVGKPFSSTALASTLGEAKVREFLCPHNLRYCLPTNRIDNEGLLRYVQYHNLPWVLDEASGLWFNSEDYALLTRSLSSQESPGHFVQDNLPTLHKLRGHSFAAAQATFPTLKSMVDAFAQEYNVDLGTNEGVQQLAWRSMMVDFPCAFDAQSGQWFYKSKAPTPLITEHEVIEAQEGYPPNYINLNSINPRFSEGILNSYERGAVPGLPYVYIQIHGRNDYDGIVPNAPKVLQDILDHAIKGQEWAKTLAEGINDSHEPTKIYIPATPQHMAALTELLELYGYEKGRAIKLISCGGAGKFDMETGIYDHGKLGALLSEATEASVQVAATSPSTNLFDDPNRAAGATYDTWLFDYANSLISGIKTEHAGGEIRRRPTLWRGYTLPLEEEIDPTQPFHGLLRNDPRIVRTYQYNPEYGATALSPTTPLLPPYYMDISVMEYALPKPTEISPRLQHAIEDWLEPTSLVSSYSRVADSKAVLNMQSLKEALENEKPGTFFALDILNGAGENYYGVVLNPITPYSSMLEGPQPGPNLLFFNGSGEPVSLTHVPLQSMRLLNDVTLPLN